MILAPILFTKRTLLIFLTVVFSAINGYAQFTYQNVPGDTSGYTPGNFNITDGGAASYSVPIIISPGSSGMQPQVSIAYSSQGGNGLMGLGWSLQGLSAITRAQQTIAQDGRNKGITFTSEDRYALDGERLIITDLGVTYGTNGAEYRTEQNAFSKIISFGNVGGGVPAYFKVWTNAGLIMEYGNSSDSRIDVNGSSPIFWLLNKVTDTKGNYYTVSYQKNSTSGEYIPLRIDYTGNASAGIVPYASVRFEYESRPDSTRKYLSGIQISSSTRRLKAIKSYYGNTIVRSYIFNYQLSPSKLSQLISFRECGTDGSCHDATTFTWKNISSFSFYPFAVNNLGLTSDDNVSSIDLNGDGVQDLVKTKIFTGGKTTPISVYTSNKDQNNLVFQTGSVSPTILNDSALVFTDFNGDGKIDVLQYAKISGLSRIYLNTTLLNSNNITFNSLASQIPNSLLNDQNIIIPADFNADGRSDLLCFNPANGNNYWLFSKMSGTATTNFEANGGTNYFQNLIPTSFFNNGNIKPLFADYNSDGLVDILFWNKSSGGLNYYQNQGGATVTFNATSVSGISSTQIIGNSTADILTNDLNSDGLPDLLYWDKSSGVNRLWINKGNNSFVFSTITFTPSGSSFANATQNADYMLPVDFNADGLTDYAAIFKNTGQARWLRNEGGFTFNWINYSGNSGSPFLDATQIQNYDFQSIGNYTSRSMMDMMFLNKNASTQLRVFRGVNDYNNLISRISSGSGQVIDITYEFMTSDSVYSKNDNAVYPLMDYQATQFVVKSYTTDDGVGGKRSMDYRYVGAKLHLNGRGFRGYSEVHMTDRTTGIIQSKYFVSDTSSYKYVRSPLVKSITRLPNGVAINIVNYENTFKSFYNGRCSYSYVKRNRSVNYEIDGRFVDSSIITWDYDDYGNVIRTVTNHGDGFKDSLVNSYSNNPTTWIIGRLLRSDLFRWAPSGQTARKSSAFEYDPVSGILTKEITEPDSSANVRIEKTYSYDNFGNILKSSTTAWNGSIIQTRSNTTSYDPLGRFVITHTNDLGHVVSKTYDQLLGSETSVTDPNGLTYKSNYDAFGRKTGMQMPDGNWSRLDYRKCGNGFNCPSLAYHAIIEQSSTNPKAVKYYDLYNKELRSEKIGFDGTVIYQDNKYDSRNLLVKKSNPYYTNETPVWTNYKYDISGRTTITIHPGNRIDSVIYNGRTTTYINPKGQRKIIVKDAKEQLTISRDHYGKDINYSYDAKGNLLKITDPNGNEISMTYDVYGNKISMNDPDMGAYKYLYNRFGEIIQQIDPKNNTTKIEYDVLGRVTKRTEAEGISQWTYDTRPNAKGFLASESNYGNYTITFDYDNFGRKTKETQVISGSTYVQQYTFDSLGRQKQITYPTGFSIIHDYNAYGYLYKIRNAVNNKLYWQVNELTARDQLIKQRYGNGLAIDRSFDINTNYLISINTQNGKGSIQQLGFLYDGIGNLSERKDLLLKKQENFEYDGLNRLLKAKIDGSDSLLMLYDELGNIVYKSDVGNYHYGSVNKGPHQLKSVDLNTKQCIPSLQINTEYYSFNKVKTVYKDSNKIEIFYNADRKRIQQNKYIGSKLVRTRLYVSSIFEKEITNNDTTEIHYIKGTEGTIAVYEIKRKYKKITTSSKYLHRDHIGSVVMVTSDSGFVLANYSYDAWGKRRNSNWTNSVSDTASLQNERGFTGHEHYDLFELIDMNGRIYDPVLACFLSPDPYIQDPTNLQNLNRYSYVVNNPLSLVDPSGHFFAVFGFTKIGGFISNWGGIFKTIGGVLMDVGRAAEHVASVAGQWVKENYKTIIVAAVAITASVLTAGALTGASALLIASVSGAAAGFASGVSATLLNGGNLKDALLAGGRGAIISSVTAVATLGVSNLAGAAGNSMSAANIGVRAIGQGTVQGLSNVVQGGKFSHGFFSGAISGAIAPTVMEKFDSKIAQVAVAAAAGGSTSAICGGKFANGAVTGAFVMMYSSGLRETMINKDPIAEALKNWKPDPKESITLAANWEIPGSAVAGAALGAAGGYALSGLLLSNPVGWAIIAGAAVGVGYLSYPATSNVIDNTTKSIERDLNTVGQ